MPVELLDQLEDGASAEAVHTLDEVLTPTTAQRLRAMGIWIKEALFPPPSEKPKPAPSGSQPAGRGAFWGMVHAVASAFCRRGRLTVGSRASDRVVDHQARKGSRNTRTRVPDRTKHSSGI
jgi:hypothetical protein